MRKSKAKQKGKGLFPLRSSRPRLPSNATYLSSWPRRPLRTPACRSRASSLSPLANLAARLRRCCRLSVSAKHRSDYRSRHRLVVPCDSLHRWDGQESCPCHRRRGLIERTETLFGCKLGWAGRRTSVCGGNVGRSEELRRKKLVVAVVVRDLRRQDGQQPWARQRFQLGLQRKRR